MSNLTELTSSNFDETIKNGVVLIDFWAPWCGPCLMQTPILEKIAETLGDKVTIAKVNVDNAQDIASNYGIQSIPTLILFKDGAIIQKMIGVQNETSLLSIIENA